MPPWVQCIIRRWSCRSTVTGPRVPQEVGIRRTFILSGTNHFAHLSLHYLKICSDLIFSLTQIYKSPAQGRALLFVYGPERDSLSPSLALALRTAAGCAKQLSCRFVEPRGLIPLYTATNSKAPHKAGLYCLYMAQRGIHSRRPWRSPCGQLLAVQNSSPGVLSNPRGLILFQPATNSKAPHKAGLYCLYMAQRGIHSRRPWRSPCGQLLAVQNGSPAVLSNLRGLNLFQPATNSKAPHKAGLYCLYMAEREGFTRAVPGARPAGSCWLCKTALLPFCRTPGFSYLCTPPQTVKPRTRRGFTVYIWRRERDSNPR